MSNLDFDQWFEAHAARHCPRIPVDRGSYLIRNEAGEVPAELMGKFAYRIESPVDLPCVVDWVKAQYYDIGTAAVIRGVFPRQTFLRRKTSGENVNF